MMQHQHGFDVYTLRSPDGMSSASFVPGHGGLGCSLIFPCEGKPREWLYRRENFWTSQQNIGGWPFLFPVCGRHRLGDQRDCYQWEGVIYPMPLHGFSMRKPWQVRHCSPQELTIVLTDDEETRVMYPFAFEVSLRYVMEDGRLTAHVVIANNGEVSMPFSAGFHPYLFTEPDRVWTLNGTWSRKGRYQPDFTHIAAWEDVDQAIQLFEDAATQCVLAYDPSNDVTLCRDEQPMLRLRTLPATTGYDFHYLQLYRSGNDPFVCVEPWLTLPNAFNQTSGSPPLLAPGAKAELTLVVEVPS